MHLTITSQNLTERNQLQNTQLKLKIPNNLKLISDKVTEMQIRKKNMNILLKKNKAFSSRKPQRKQRSTIRQKGQQIHYFYGEKEMGERESGCIIPKGVPRWIQPPNSQSFLSFSLSKKAFRLCSLKGQNWLMRQQPVLFRFLNFLFLYQLMIEDHDKAVFGALFPSTRKQN